MTQDKTLWQIFFSNPYLFDLHVAWFWWSNMFPWQLLLWKWVKDIFTVIIATVAKRKKCFIGKFHDKYIEGMSPLPHGFFEFFIGGRYHRDTKILQILASNSKQFRVYGNFKNDKLMMIGAAKYYIFLDNFCLK